MSATTAAPAHGGMRSFSIALPDDWARLPLEERAFRAAVDAHRQRWADAGVDRTGQRRLELLLQRVAADLRAVDVVFAASAMTATGDGVRLETCTLSTYAQADLGTELRITATLLFHAFAVRVVRSPNEPRIADLEPPVRCTLPCGEAVRLRRLYTAATSSRHVERFYGEAYALPLGDAGTHAAMLQFATTDVDHAARSSVGYREVAESLAFAPADPGTN